MPKSRPASSSTAAADGGPGTAPGGSAQQIWLAGLGALAQAQAQGSKAFETLVSDGLRFQQKTQAEAQQRLQEATERLTHMAQDFGQQASGRVDRLEQMFEERVARALERLGMPTMAQLQALQERVTALERATPPAAKAPKSVASVAVAGRTRASAKTRSR